MGYEHLRETVPSGIELASAVCRAGECAMLRPCTVRAVARCLVTVEGVPRIADDVVITNQKKILADQERIVGNQEKTLANQVRIEGNQAKLDKILANQKKILA